MLKLTCEECGTCKRMPEFYGMSTPGDRVSSLGEEFTDSRAFLDTEFKNCAKNHYLPSRRQQDSSLETRYFAHDNCRPAIVIYNMVARLDYH